MIDTPTIRALVRARDTDAVWGDSQRLSLRAIATRFWPYMRPYKRRVAAILALVVIAPLLETAMIWMYKLAVDEVIAPHDLARLIPVGAALAGLTISQSAAVFADEYLSAWVAERFLLGLRAAVFSHLHRLSLSFFERRRHGDVIARLTGDVSAIETLMLSGLADGLTYALRIVLFTGALFVLSWQLALLALVVSPLFWLATRHFSREIKSASRKQRRRSGMVSAVVEESLGNAAIVQAYSREAGELERLLEQGEGTVAAKIDVARLRGLFSLLTDSLELVGALLVLGLGTWELSAGNISIGGLVAFLAYLSQMYSPIRRLGRLINTMHAASASAERIIELLDEQPAVKDPAAPRSRQARGRLEFDAVDFAYPDTARGALHGLSLSVAAGETGGWWPAAPASPRWPSWRCASTTPTAAPLRWTGSTCASSHSRRCGARSRSSAGDADPVRRHDPRQHRRSVGPARPRGRWWRRPRPPARTSSSPICRRLRDARRTTRAAAVWRAATADRDGAGDGQGRADPDPRRADHGARRGVGSTDGRATTAG